MNNSNKALLLAIQKGYKVDSHGSVYSKSGRKRVLKYRHDGYLAFNMRGEGRKIHVIPVHRLQALQKYGTDMFKYDCVRHLNGDKTDNSFGNIEVGSTMDNWMDINEEERMRIVSTANMKYPVSVVLEIREKHKSGMRMSKLMEEYDITSKGTFSHILNKRVVNY